MFSTTLSKWLRLLGIGGLPVVIGCSGPADSQQDSGDTETVATSSEALTGQRPLLVVLMKRADNRALGHTWSWYNDRIFGVAGGRNVASYYSALSGNRFTFSRASMLSVRDPETPEFDARAGVVSGDEEPVVHAKRARLLAADVGFDYSLFDANGNGTVSEKELAILAIDKYTLGGGKAPPAGCLSVSGVNVCGPIALAGHRSAMVNYAHELAHLLSPAPFDLYGASNSSGDVPCYNWHMALQSCTSSDVADDSTSTYFMDPWHRGARYGWITIRANVSLSSVSSGSQTLPPVGFGTSGIAESLELLGPNSESVTFEYRSRGANAYEDGVFRDGVIAWYRKAKTNGDPADIPSLQPNTTDLDTALFTLAPVGCKLNPNDIASRGMVAALTPGSYRLTWSNGADSGFLFTITPGFLSYVVSYSRTNAAPIC